MDMMRFGKKESLVALLGCLAVRLWCSECESWLAFAWSKGLAALLGIVCWLLGRKLDC